MTGQQETIIVEMIPVDQITVINPRIRNRKIFRQIVDSISMVGLKKPITVSRNHNGDDEPPYQLVCGQGRLEAFISLGEREIPAIVVDVTTVPPGGSTLFGVDAEEVREDVEEVVAERRAPFERRREGFRAALTEVVRGLVPPPSLYGR